MYFRVNDGTCGPATTDVTLSVSRDGGRTFEYVSREAVLSPGLAGSWSSKRVWVLPTPFQEGDTQTIVYGAYNVDENARIDGPTQSSGKKTGKRILCRTEFVRSQTRAPYRSS